MGGAGETNLGQAKAKSSSYAETVIVVPDNVGQRRAALGRTGKGAWCQRSLRVECERRTRRPRAWVWNCNPLTIDVIGLHARHTIAEFVFECGEQVVINLPPGRGGERLDGLGWSESVAREWVGSGVGRGWMGRGGKAGRAEAGLGKVSGAGRGRVGGWDEYGGVGRDDMGEWRRCAQLPRGWAKALCVQYEAQHLVLGCQTD